MEGNPNPNSPIYDGCGIGPRYGLFGPQFFEWVVCATISGVRSLGHYFLEWVVWATIFGDGSYSMPASENEFLEAGVP